MDKDREQPRIARGQEYRDYIRRTSKDKFYLEDNRFEHTWAVYRSTAREYSDVFEDVLPEGVSDIFEWVGNRRKAGKPLVAVDLMSEGMALRQLFPDAGLAVGLSDQRDVDDEEYDRATRIDMITGDLLRTRTWQAIEGWLADHSPTGKADLIMERGVGGLRNIPNDPKLYHVLINRLWNSISSDNGLLLLQSPAMSGEILQPWAKQVREKTGIAIQVATEPRVIDIGGESFQLDRLMPVLSMERKPEDPDIIPGFQSNNP